MLRVFGAVKTIKAGRVDELASTRVTVRVWLSGSLEDGSVTDEVEGA